MKEISGAGRHGRWSLSRGGFWGAMRMPLAAAGLGLMEAALVIVQGSPVAQLRVLGELGAAWADPTASMLALMALLAQGLVAYLLAVLLLRSLALLPGLVGRLAARVTLLIAPVTVRRAFDLLVGGSLVAQATLGLGLPTTFRSPPAATVPVASMALVGPPVAARADLAPVALATGTGAPAGFQDEPRPVETRPALRRSSAPLPPWLGGGPSMPSPPSTSGPPVDPPFGTPPPRTSPPGPSERAAEAQGSLGESLGRRGPNPDRDEAGGEDARGDRPEPDDGRPRTDGDRPTGDDPPDASGDRPDTGDGGVRGAQYLVAPRDTLWDIAAAHLRPADRSAGNIDRYWRQVYRANRSAAGPDPDLIHPGTRLRLPPFRRDLR
jgi:hypothetical protein